jgi:alpha-N-arabinofuranosidase
LNSLVRNCDRLKLACLAQLINVIAPIMTNKDGLFRQTIYYPYSWALQYARGAALNLLVESSTYDVAGMEQVPHVDAAGSFNSSDGSVCLFILNRDLSKAHELEILWEEHAPARVLNVTLLTGDDLKASNSFEAPQRVVPQPFAKPSTTGDRTKFEVPARSYTVLQWSM